ncbi:MAG TPA: hypothetical protein PLR06_12845 [Cyclobacteriaceae bacterium]|nr:hypothetical protein [Cyclobacteriaceae bacterium]
MTPEKAKPERSRKLILVLGLTVLASVSAYAYYTTQQFLKEQSEQGKIISAEVVVRELAGIAVEFVKKTIEKYKGG